MNSAGVDKVVHEIAVISYNIQLPVVILIFFNIEKRLFYIQFRSVQSRSGLAENDFVQNIVLHYITAVALVYPFYFILADFPNEFVKEEKLRSRSKVCKIKLLALQVLEFFLRNCLRTYYHVQQFIGKKSKPFFFLFFVQKLIEKVFDFLRGNLPKNVLVLLNKIVTILSGGVFYSEKSVQLQEIERIFVIHAVGWRVVYFLPFLISSPFFNPKLSRSGKFQKPFHFCPKLFLFLVLKCSFRFHEVGKIFFRITSKIFGFGKAFWEPCSLDIHMLQSQFLPSLEACRVKVWNIDDLKCILEKHRNLSLGNVCCFRIEPNHSFARRSHI